MAMIMLMSGILTLFVFFFIVFGGENFEAPKRFEYTGHEKGEGKGIIRYKRGKKETEKQNTTTMKHVKEDLVKEEEQDIESEEGKERRLYEGEQ